MNTSKRLKIASERFAIAAAAGIATILVLAWWRGTPVEGKMQLLALSLAGFMGVLTFLIRNRNER